MTPPPCRCAHPATQHEHGTRSRRVLVQHAGQSDQWHPNRCQHPGCGCLRYRPDLTKG